MVTKTATRGFEECADLISEQRYGAALASFKQAVSRLLDSKSSPKRNEVARQLLQVATALEEALKRAYGKQWDTAMPEGAPESQDRACSFCGKGPEEARKLIAGPSVFICDACVGLCDEILEQEDGAGSDCEAAPAPSPDSEERLCGICMEPRETDELVFLPHAAYMCATCLEEIQIVRDKQARKVET